MINEGVKPLLVDISKLYTVQNYSKAFGISRPTVYKKIESKEIKKININGVTFVHP